MLAKRGFISVQQNPLDIVSFYNAPVGALIILFSTLPTTGITRIEYHIFLYDHGFGQHKRYRIQLL